MSFQIGVLYFTMTCFVQIIRNRGAVRFMPLRKVFIDVNYVNEEVPVEFQRESSIHFWVNLPDSGCQNV